MPKRFKFYIDENLIPSIANPLCKVFHKYQFKTPENESLWGVLDEPLFEELALRKFDAIITGDKRQLLNGSERRALVDANLHWIHYEQQQGDKGLAVATRQISTVTMGLPHVIANWRTDPTAYFLPTLSHPVPTIQAL